MIGQIIYSLALTLSIDTGLASIPSTHEVTALTDVLTKVGSKTRTFDVHFAIDVNNLRRSDYISSGPLDWYSLNGESSGKLVLSVGEGVTIIKLTLSSSKGDIIAQDVMVPGIKENVAFNSRTNAQTGVVSAANVYGATPEEQISIYQRAPSHKQFGELEAIYLGNRGWPTIEPASKQAGYLEVTIAFDILEEVRD